MQLLGQDNLDKILRAELSQSGCEVELGVELEHLEQFDDRVKVSLLRHNLDSTKQHIAPIKEEGFYDWVVGSDGAKGAVRKELGLKLLGETTPHSFITGDFKLEGLENNVRILLLDFSAEFEFRARDGIYGETWRRQCKIIPPFPMDTLSFYDSRKTLRL
jgi:2-polyprenyl-6-methoxyphenol hydroxylase-like FAD-dependent oxidoreductase